MLKITSATTAIESESLTITIYLDGFVLVNQNIELNQQTLSINVTLLGTTHQNLLVIDENNLPLDYTIMGNNTTIYNIGSTKINLSYLTQDLTSKIGKYWTVTLDYPNSKQLVLPENTSIISLSDVPDLIESSNTQITLTMPPGLTQVTYITEHPLNENTRTLNQTDLLQNWQIILSLLIIIPLALTGFWLLKNKKKPNPKTKPQEQQNTVNLDKLLRKHRELRQDEIQVVHFLASKHGKALEAELFELLNLPRTTTWRLIRRLESMDIVSIKKSRRQNTVLIQDKYLIKQKTSH